MPPSPGCSATTLSRRRERESRLQSSSGGAPQSGAAFQSGDPPPRSGGFEPCRRQDRSSGAILGEKALRAMLEWRGGPPEGRWRGRGHAVRCGSAAADRGRIPDRREHHRRPPLKFLSRKPQRADTCFASHASRRASWSCRSACTGPIDFDAELRRRTVEIEDVGAERVLAAEVQAQPVASQHGPQCLLRLRQVPPPWRGRPGSPGQARG